MSVVVLGSINIDLVVQVPQLPAKGETVIGQKFLTVGGGKGANQAVAVARLGFPVSLVGQVGADDFGTTLLQGLQQAGVNINAIAVNQETHSGVASIVVDDQGDNTIACAAGANHQVGETQLQQLRTLLPQAKVLLLELGIPLDTVVAAAKIAKEAGITVILDPAPARDNLPIELYQAIDIITPNEVEASQLVGFPVNNPATASQAASVLRQQGVENVIITLGNQGAFCATTQKTWLLPPIAVETIDSTAAGDAFNGALAAALASGISFPQAVKWGTIAGALTVTKAGAQSSLPTKEAFQTLLTSTV